MKELIALEKEFSLESFDNKALARIEQGMLEVRRATKAFGRHGTQTMNKLMTLTMLSHSPYRTLRQCLAEIEKRKKAVQEAIFNLRKDKIKAERFRASGDDLDLIEAEQLELKIAESQLYVEGALKDIASFQESYTQVRDAHNIPEDWDESDFEKAEIEHHVKEAFLHAYRDIMSHKSLGMGTLEYLDQFGIHPYTAQHEVMAYISSFEEARKQGRFPSIKNLYAWLDNMCDKYKNEYTASMERIGITELITPWCQYLESK